MSNQASPEEGLESNGNSSSPGAVSTAVNSLEETEFTCHIYDGSEGAIRLPEPRAKPAFRKKEEVVVEDTKDSISSVNPVFRRMRVALTGSKYYLLVTKKLHPQESGFFSGFYKTT